MHNTYRKKNELSIEAEFTEKVSIVRYLLTISSVFTVTFMTILSVF